MIKLVTWIVFAIILTVSLFVPEIEVSNTELAIMIMMLLLALVSELKEFNFWGLKGKVNEPNLKELEGQKAIGGKKVKVDNKTLGQAERSSAPFQLSNDPRANFLAFTFEIERLLQVYANIGLTKELPPTLSSTNLAQELRKANLLTDAGVQQVDGIQWLRNALVHADQELSQETLDAGLEIARGLYVELYRKLYSQDPVLA